MRAKEIVGVRTVIRVIGRDFFAALLVFVPVVQAVLFIGVDMALLFLAAPGNSKCADQYKCDLERASSTHG
jgi:hypothetical protein